MGVAADEQDKGNERGDTTVQDGGTDVDQGGGGTGPAVPLHRQERVADVGRVVHA